MQKSLSCWHASGKLADTSGPGFQFLRPRWLGERTTKVLLQMETFFCGE